MNENQTKVRFAKRVKDLVSTDAPDFWKTFKDGALKACDEVCGKKKSRGDRGDMWWGNEEVKNTEARKKAAFKEQCRFPSEENMTQYKRIRNQTRKIFARAMKMEANQELSNVYQNSNSVLCFLRRMKKKGKNVEVGRCLRGNDKRGKDVEVGRCLRGNDKQLGFIEENRTKIWRKYMEKIMNEDHMVETDVVEGKVAYNKIVGAMQKMKSVKATGPSEVSVEMIVASGEIGVKVMMELC